MARLPRLAVSGFAHHVLVRGNNSQAVFLDNEDLQGFVTLLSELVPQWRIALHAYVLLPNQFQLLLTPQNELGLPKLMQSLGRRHAAGFNKRHRRTGTLWEGRYRSVILEPNRHFLECMVWMDTQPVRRQLVNLPREHIWSSCRHHLGLEPTGFISPHAQYWALGNTPFAREAAYASRLECGLSCVELERWETESAKGWVMGTPDFINDLQKLTPRRLRPGKPGRPHKTQN